jgi:ABC-2 type transport system ATP-binding protein
VTALLAEGLTQRYGDRVALDDVSFAIETGEVVAVIGPNGAGKTTLLSILGGVQRPTAGTVSRDPSEIGWVPQQSAVYSKLSVQENLRLFARLDGAGDAAVQHMLDQTGLLDRADDEVASLSGGNRQRVNIAVGLLRQPAVLLLDEPSAALDPRQRARLWEFIGSLVEGGTAVVFTTHDVGEAQRFADRLLVLADGELLFTGTPDDLHASVDELNPDLETAFVSFLRQRGH